MAPAPGNTKGQIAPTAKKREAMATPMQPVCGSCASIEKVTTASGGSHV
jgi:hypothetical protein